jgi:hypothetical protein
MRDGNFSGFRRVFELAVAPGGPNENPSIGFEPLDDLAAAFRHVGPMLMRIFLHIDGPGAKK